MKRSHFGIGLICLVVLALWSSLSFAWGGSSHAQVVSMFVNADGTCQARSGEITLCESSSPGEYRIEFDRFAFDEVAVVVVMPLGGATVSSISQNSCSKSNPCTTPRSGWFAIYTLSEAATHNFIAATGY